MIIKELKIEGFKSIGKIELKEPNPFTVFVGPNAAGKSNIFEALEFMEMCNVMGASEVIKQFGNPEDIFNKISISVKRIEFIIDFEKLHSQFYVLAKVENEEIKITTYGGENFGGYNTIKKPSFKNNDLVHFTNFSRLFIGKESLDKRKFRDDSKLTLDASNLEKVLKRILKDEKNREEIFELLQLLIPGFENVEIKTIALAGADNLLIYEESLKKPLNKKLISDGTYNIIALITAVYQSEEPQFLLIEEPENGLNPKVVRELVNLFRDKCKEKGHYIWLNTHSQTLVSELLPEEIILVDKVKGLTQCKQIKDKNLHGMKMDEALLTNALGGGIPW